MRLAAYLMMRSLAWCGTISLTSSMPSPARRSTSSTASGMAFVANLNTFCPCMCSTWCGAPAAIRSVCSYSSWMEAKLGSGSSSAAGSMPASVNGCGVSNAFMQVSALSISSSLRMDHDKMPGFVSSHSTTAAPAPSPNSTHVLRSFQSMMRERRSLPMTNAWRMGLRPAAPGAPAAAAAIMDSAMVSP